MVLVVVLVLLLVLGWLVAGSLVSEEVPMISSISITLITGSTSPSIEGAVSRLLDLRSKVRLQRATIFP